MPVVAFGMQWFFDFVQSLAGIIFDACWWFFTEFYSWAYTELKPFITSCFSALNLNTGLMWAENTCSILNYFVPLNETLVMLSMLFFFWLSVLVVKIVLKLIPWIY